jgi:hypothetical protein
MPLTRFLTRWYVAVDEAEARRLAVGDGTTQVAIVAGLELLHVEHGWALWSDGEVTTSTGLPEALRSVRSLAPAAVALISEVKHNLGGGPPQIEGGWRSLARVVEVVRDEVTEEGSAEGDFEPARVRRLVVRLDDGSERVWWVRTASRAAGVTFEISDPAAQRVRLPRGGAALLN